MGRRKKGEEAKYAYTLVHQQLKKLYGKAAEHLCVLCNGQANDWSCIIYTDYSEPDKSRYSKDMSNYLPMCRSCNAKWGKQDKKQFCHNGHDNWREYPSGRRRCITCDKTRRRKRYLKTKEDS